MVIARWMKRRTLFLADMATFSIIFQRYKTARPSLTLYFNLDSHSSRYLSSHQTASPCPPSSRSLLRKCLSVCGRRLAAPGAVGARSELAAG